MDRTASATGGPGPSAHRPALASRRSLLPYAFSLPLPVPPSLKSYCREDHFSDAGHCLDQLYPKNSRQVIDSYCKPSTPANFLSRPISSISMRRPTARTPTVSSCLIDRDQDSGVMPSFAAMDRNSWSRFSTAGPVVVSRQIVLRCAATRSCADRSFRSLIC